MAARLDDIVEAVDFVSWDGGYTENAAYVRKDDGAVFYSSDIGDFDPLPEDIDDGSRYVAVSDKRDLDLGRELVFSFAREHLPEDVDTVYAYFRRSGAYSRFKELAESRNLLDRWYSYEQEEMRSAVLKWCESVNLEIEEDALKD